MLVTCKNGNVKEYNDYKFSEYEELIIGMGYKAQHFGTRNEKRMVLYIYEAEEKINNVVGVLVDDANE